MHPSFKTQTHFIGSGRVFPRSGISQEKVQDSEFDWSQELGFIKIGHRRGDIDMRRKWDAGFS